MNYGSLFAGIGGFDLGFDRGGMRCAWQVDNEASCNTVLRQHWPDVQRYGDVHDVGKRNLAPVDLIAGGFPCQDLSVAGRRAGLAGERSGLWYEFARVIEELKPRWVVVENVTGLLSSYGTPDPPDDLCEGQEWKTEEESDFAIILRGLAECGYMGAYRVLDAQFYGVAQRRRRVFIVGHLGDGRAAEVLFECTGGAWASPPSREAREGVAALTKSGVGTCGADDNQALAGHLMPFDTTQITSKINRSHPRYGDLCHPLAAGAYPPAIAFQCHGSNVGPMGTLRSGNAGLTGGVPFVARSLNSHAGRDNETLVTCPLESHSGRYDVNQPYVFDQQSGGDVRLNVSSEHTSALQASQVPAVMQRFGVRRLTPRECERLQGFPDDWTQWGIDESGKQVELSDSARYRMLGNAVCVPVAEWIGRRIVARASS